LRSFAPPFVLPDISPSRGEIRLSGWLSPIADDAAEALRVKLLISPLGWEMSGRTKGGARGHLLSDSGKSAAPSPP